MKVTKEWMEKYYVQFNQEYFNDLLPPIGNGISQCELMPVNKKAGYLGKAYWRNDISSKFVRKSFKIVLNNHYTDLVEIEWMNVLLHEMIHIWQFISGYKGGHGKSFLRKAEEINKYGWDITTTYKKIKVKNISNKKI